MKVNQTRLKTKIMRRSWKKIQKVWRSIQKARVNLILAVYNERNRVISVNLINCYFSVVEIEKIFLKTIDLSDS